METESYGDIGTLLRRGREEQGLSLEKVSQLMHIRVRYIDALEHGRLEELPGFAYTKGYLQAYAAFLSLDKDEILRRFEQIEGMLARRGFYFPQAFSKEKAPHPLFVWGGLGIAFLIYIVWLLVLQPSMLPISVVERFPGSDGEKTAVSAATLKDVACLRPQDVYYPPCYAARGRHFSLIPLQGHLDTVMRLAK